MGIAGAAPAPRLGPYELERCLGSGGMAEVFLARRIGEFEGDERVAVKRILPGCENNQRIVQMFCDEARLVAKLPHPNIVQVVDFGEDEGRLFIAMEYVDGVSCSKILRAIVDRGARVPLPQALFIGKEVLKALDFAHAAVDDDDSPLNIVHRDVSPSNILVSRGGDVKLIDFGITRSRLNARCTIPGELKGKLRYMSPEQVVGGDVDARSDLFAAGIVLGELLLGRSLFGSRSDLETLTRICRGDLGPIWDDDLPGDVRDMLLSALAFRTADRFQTAAHFIDVIDVISRDRGIALDPAMLSTWLASMGVLSSASGTRVRAVREPERVVGRARVVAPFSAPPTVAEPRRNQASSTNVRTTVPPPRNALRSKERRCASVELEEGADIEALAARVTRLPPPPARTQLRSGAYRIRTRSGTLAPLTRPQLLEMLATGRLTAASKVSLDGVRYYRVEQLPALAPLASRRVYQFNATVGKAEWKRPLVRATLPRALYDLVAQRRTGVLIARDDRRQKRIYLSAGDPVFVASTLRSELLGVRLLASGAVTPKLVELAMRQQPPMKIGEALVTLGALAPARLVRELVAQLEQRCTELGGWSQGELTFVPDEKPEESTVQTHTTALHLTTRLVREHFEPAEIARILRSVANEHLTRGPKYRTLATLVGLNPREYAALERASAAVSTQALATELGRERIASWADTLRAVFIGLSAGLLQAAGWPEACEEVTRPIE